jgi:hypothetical protein
VIYLTYGILKSLGNLCFKFTEVKHSVYEIPIFETKPIQTRPYSSYLSQHNTRVTCLQCSPCNHLKDTSIHQFISSKPPHTSTRSSAPPPINPSALLSSPTINAKTLFATTASSHPGTYPLNSSTTSKCHCSNFIFSP